jgi:hypothetical protein
MDVLTEKTFQQYDYTCRYTGVPYYYNKEDGKYVYGISANMIKGLPWVAHKVKQEDTWDSLALNYYNNPTLFWVICYFNDVIDPFDEILNRYEIVKIPTLTSIEFDDRRK